MSDKQNRAAERAEVLESMTPEDREAFRKRKPYVAVRHDWKNYFTEMPAAEVKDLLLAIIEYDETGILPEFKNPMNAAVFAGFMKSFIDSLFDDFCYACYKARENGAKGGGQKALNTAIVSRYVEKFGSDTFQGVGIREIIKDKAAATRKLQIKGASKSNIDFIFSQVEEIRAEIESEKH